MRELEKLLDQLRLRFTSGNSVPVQRAHITRQEFEQLEREVARLRTPAALTAKLLREVQGD